MPPDPVQFRLRATDRMFQVIDGNILRSLIGTEPDLKKLKELDDLFSRNKGK